MSERTAFLAALAENEDDTTARLVYADWLDERGEHDEADRQRKWPAAKEWLVRFCRAHNPADDQDPDEWFISYEQLVELGQHAVEQKDNDGFYFSCGNNMGMCDALRAHGAEFWKNWSVVTGVPLPPDAAHKTSFVCAC